VKCRRARHRCNGCLRCSELDPALVNVTRYELDPAPRTAVINAEIATRQEEGDTPEKLAAAFHRSITSKEKKCKAIDSMGAPCMGDYMMKRRTDGTQRKDYFIACTEWTPVWRGHNTFNIRDEVDETLLAQLFSDAGAFTSGSETAACSRIISPRTGERQKFCAHIHLRQGKSVRGNMIHHACKAYMTIYVPVDTSLRMACVLFDHLKPHTHPMPPMKKASLDVKKVYRRCVKAMGALGTTVQKVDDAPTTLLLLKGQSPAMFHPSLHSKRFKQTVVRDEKLLASPAGLGFAGEISAMSPYISDGVGVIARHIADMKLEEEDRYIHRVLITPDSHILIITMVSKLANLVHFTRTIQVDTTFGRTVGSLNETSRIENLLMSFHFALVLTIGRLYTDGSDRPHYKFLFDELQKVIFELTGKHLRFKRFTPGGNLITLGVDMEAAQVQGASESFLPTNVPEYSGIHTTDPDEFAETYVRACTSHAKRGVHGLRPYVNDAQFKRLMDFPYLKTEEDFNRFTAWVSGLNIKKVQDWWKHKLQYRWIPSSLIKTRSGIHPDDWDITDGTTNLNEGQHHWTNQQTGTKLTILEAIETARKVDFKTALEVQDSLDTGLLDNPSNNLLHRMGRKVQRGAAAVKKTRASNEEQAEITELQVEYDAKKAAKKLLDKQVKDLGAELSASKGTKKRKSRTVATASGEPLLQATSSGR
ncbi:hypothetical protein FB451DRAFT_966547, partial [Mycena latifolia]